MTPEEINYINSRFDRLEKQNDMILIYLAGMTTRVQFIKIKKAIDKRNSRELHHALDIERIREYFKQ